ncbi:MAG: hypothetical protein AB1791_02715 [Chloroflexota bacterium]
MAEESATTLPQTANSTARSEAGLPLPDPFPEYIPCPYCGEPEVEVWCYQDGVTCHNCGRWIEHRPLPCVGSSAHCVQHLSSQS